MVTKDARPIGYAHSSREKFQRGPLKVMVTMITLWSFLFTSVGPLPTVAWAAKPPTEFTSVGSERGGGPGFPGEPAKELRTETFTLPEYLGTVRDAWTSQAKAAGREPQLMVIHIQDAHCNYEGQHRIADILQYVNKEYGVKTVNLEGGVKTYDLSPLSSITEAEVRQKVSDYFVKNGRVNGAEYCAINNPGTIDLWGIEDTLLYIENLAIYRASLEHKREIDTSLGALGAILTQIKVKRYPKDLLELDSKYVQYKAANLEFKDYLSYLIAQAASKSVDLAAYPSIELLNRTLAEEAKIDFRQTTAERDELVRLLEKKLSRAVLSELAARTVDFKAGRISQKNYYAYLIAKARAVAIDDAPYTNLNAYIRYVTMYETIDKMKIMGEMTALETALKERMFTDDTQRRLDLLSKNLVLLKNLFNISLTKDDYRYYLDNKPTFDMQHYLDFIRKEAPQATLGDGIARIDTYRNDIAKFYSFSVKRDEAFLKNMRTETRRARGETPEMRVAIMVTGGFHTENLCEMFRKANIAYVSISPSFRNEAGYQSPYYDLLGGRETKIEKLIDAAFSSIQIYDFLTELGVAVDGERAKNRFLLSVDILKVLQVKGTCTARTKFNETITFIAEKDEAGTIVNITYTVAPAPKDQKGLEELDRTPTDLTITDIGPLLYQTQAAYINPMVERAFTDGNHEQVAEDDIEAVAGYLETALGRKDIAEQLRQFAETGHVNLIWGDYVKGFFGHVGTGGTDASGKPREGGIYINRNKFMKNGVIDAAAKAALRATLLHEALAYYFAMGEDFNHRAQDAFVNNVDAIGLRMELKDVVPQPFAMRPLAALAVTPTDYLDQTSLGNTFNTFGTTTSTPAAAASTAAPALEPPPATDRRTVLTALSLETHGIMKHWRDYQTYRQNDLETSPAWKLSNYQGIIVHIDIQDLAGDALKTFMEKVVFQLAADNMAMKISDPSRTLTGSDTGRTIEILLLTKQDTPLADAAEIGRELSRIDKLIRDAGFTKTEGLAFRTDGRGRDMAHGDSGRLGWRFGSYNSRFIIDPSKTYADRVYVDDKKIFDLGRSDGRGIEELARRGLLQRIPSTQIHLSWEKSFPMQMLGSQTVPIGPGPMPRPASMDLAAMTPDDRRRAIDESDAQDLNVMQALHAFFRKLLRNPALSLAAVAPGIGMTQSMYRIPGGKKSTIAPGGWVIKVPRFPDKPAYGRNTPFVDWINEWRITEDMRGTPYEGKIIANDPVSYLEDTLGGRAARKLTNAWDKANRTGSKEDWKTLYDLVAENFTIEENGKRHLFTVTKYAADTAMLEYVLESPAKITQTVQYVLNADGTNGIRLSAASRRALETLPQSSSMRRKVLDTCLKDTQNILSSDLTSRLQDALERARIDDLTVMPVFKELAGLIRYMRDEKGIYHRDIKPSNVMVRLVPQPGGSKKVELAAVIDFGLAVRTEGRGNAMASSVPFAGVSPFTGHFLQRLAPGPEIADLYGPGGLAEFLTAQDEFSLKAIEERIKSPQHETPFGLIGPTGDKTWWMYLWDLYKGPAMQQGLGLSGPQLYDQAYQWMTRIQNGNFTERLASLGHLSLQEALQDAAYNIENGGTAATWVDDMGMIIENSSDRIGDLILTINTNTETASKHLEKVAEATDAITKGYIQSFLNLDGRVSQRELALVYAIKAFDESMARASDMLKSAQTVSEAAAAIEQALRKDANASLEVLERADRELAKASAALVGGRRSIATLAEALKTAAGSMGAIKEKALFSMDRPGTRWEQKIDIRQALAQAARSNGPQHLQFDNALKNFETFLGNLDAGAQKFADRANKYAAISVQGLDALIAEIVPLQKKLESRIRDLRRQAEIDAFEERLNAYKAANAAFNEDLERAREKLDSITRGRQAGTTTGEIIDTSPSGPAGSQDPAGLMGKYTPITPPVATPVRNIPRAVLISMKVRDLKTGEEKTVSLRAVTHDLTDVDTAMQQLVAPGNTYSPAVRTIANWFLSSRQQGMAWEAYALVDPAEMESNGIYGIGMPGFIAVPVEVAKRAPALLHEIGHAFYLQGAVQADATYRQNIFRTLIGPAVERPAGSSDTAYAKLCNERQLLLNVFLDHLAANTALMPPLTRAAFNKCNTKAVREVAETNRRPARRDRADALFAAFVKAAIDEGWDNTLWHYALRTLQGAEMVAEDRLLSDVIDPLQARWHAPLAWEESLFSYLRNPATPREETALRKTPPLDAEGFAALTDMTRTAIPNTSFAPFKSEAHRSTALYRITAPSGGEWFIKYAGYTGFADHTVLLVWLKEWRVTEALRAKPLAAGTVAANDPVSFLKAIGRADAAAALEEAWQKQDWPRLVGIIRANFVVNGSLFTATRFLEGGRFLNAILTDQVTRINDIVNGPGGEPAARQERDRALATDRVIFALLEKLTNELHARGITHGDIKPANIYIEFNAAGEPVSASFIDAETAGIAEQDAAGNYRFSKFLHGIMTRVYGHIYNNRREEYEKLRGKDLAAFLEARDAFSLAVIKFVLTNPRLSEPLLREEVVPGAAGGKNWWDHLAANPKSTFPIMTPGGIAFDMAMKQAITEQLALELMAEQEAAQIGVAAAANAAAIARRQAQAGTISEATRQALRLARGLPEAELSFYRLNRTLGNALAVLDEAAALKDMRAIADKLEEAKNYLSVIRQERSAVHEYGRTARDTALALKLESDTNKLMAARKSLGEALDTLGFMRKAAQRFDEAAPRIADALARAERAVVNGIEREPLDRIDADFIAGECRMLLSEIRAETLPPIEARDLDRIRKMETAVNKALSDRLLTDIRTWGAPFAGNIPAGTVADTAEKITAEAMGKYEIVSDPVFTRTGEENGAETGTITLRIRAMTPDANGVRAERTITLKAKALAMPEVWQAVSTVAGLSTFVGTVSAGFMGTAYALTDEAEMAREGIFGIGFPGFIAVPESLARNGTALLHEIGHAALLNDTTLADTLLLDPLVKNAYNAYIAKGEGREKLRNHYVLRAFAETYLTESDREVEAEIDRIQGKAAPAETGSAAAYKSSLIVHGTFTTPEEVAALSFAVPVYETLIDSAPEIVSILSRDVDTFDLAPAPAEDTAKSESIDKTAERRLKKNGFGVYADNYAYGTGEDWYKRLTDAFDGMAKQYADSVRKSPTARFAVRMIGTERRADLEAHIAQILAKYLEGDELKLAIARVRVISIDLSDATHLNIVPDLIADILAMEFDRYAERDYPGDGRAPEGIVRHLARVFNMTAMIPRLSETDQDAVRDFLTRIFRGELLRIRAIDWKTIDAWKKSQDAVLQAL